MKTILTIVLFIGMSFSEIVFGVEVDRGTVLNKIAEDIVELKKEYPQLIDFEAPIIFRENEFSISYSYNTGPAPRTGGWSSGVPSPKSGGVWFYISLHSPDSTRQIHTQPVASRTYLGKYAFQFVIKEGERTKLLNTVMWEIFRKHGVTEKRDSN